MPGQYDSLFSRLVANSDPGFEDEEACWSWLGKKRASCGYGRINVHVPGLGRQVALTAHVLSWVLRQIGYSATANEAYLAYLEVSCSGYQLDHECVNVRCINPDHLSLRTHLENQRLRALRGVQRGRYASSIHA